MNFSRKKIFTISFSVQQEEDAKSYGKFDSTEQNNGIAKNRKKYEQCNMISLKYLHAFFFGFKKRRFCYAKSQFVIIQCIRSAKKMIFFDNFPPLGK